jgi:CRISPR-associated exonuclease Cas4
MKRDEVGGVHVKYLHHCAWQLWLYVHGYRPESGSDLVALGEQMDTESFRRARRDIDLGHARIDWLSGTAVVHETKSSRKPAAAHVAQARLYLALLRERGVPAVRAVIHYPVIRRTVEVLWDDDTAKQVEDDRDTVLGAVSLPLPPPRLPMTRCRGCSYLDYCWGGEPR